MVARDCYSFVRVLDTMQLLGCFGWLLGHRYAAARVFWLVARALPISCLAVLCGCWGITMELLGCFRWFLWHCYGVARVFKVVARALL